MSASVRPANTQGRPIEKEAHHETEPRNVAVRRPGQEAPGPAGGDAAAHRERTLLGVENLFGAIAVPRLEDEGLIAPVPHAADLVSPTRRFHLTAAGLRRLAQEEGMSLDDLLRSRPVSARWRRVLLEGLDALAVVYRLASNVANIAHPIRFRWYRAMPMDAAVALPGGRVIAVVRQGLASDRTGFSKRLWRLREGPRFGGVLLLMPDEVRLRYAGRLLARSPAPAFLALERDAAAGIPDSPVWRPPPSAPPSACAPLSTGCVRAARFPRSSHWRGPLLPLTSTSVGAGEASPSTCCSLC